MRQQFERRDSKTFAVVGEECGIPTPPVENYRGGDDRGPVAPADPRNQLTSMSEFDKGQSYDVYDYQTATRPEQGQHAYGSGFAAHPNYPAGYVATQAQVPSGLPQSTTNIGLVPSAQQFQTHDPTYYGQQVAQYPAYLDPSPRPVPAIQDYAPKSGPPGTHVTIYFQSVYDFDAPQVTPIIMFGSKRCESVLTKTPQGQSFQYSLASTAPSLASTNSPSGDVPIHLILDDSAVNWESPTCEVGNFSYLEQPSYYQLDSPKICAQPQIPAPRKRKLSPESSPRRSPTKKMSMHNLSSHHRSQFGQSPTAGFRRPSMPVPYQHSRRISSNAEYQPAYTATIASQQQYYGQPSQPTPTIQTSQSPSWSYTPTMVTTRSPSAATMAAASRSASQILPSPSVGHAPPLIRTTTLHGSPTDSAIMSATVAPAFNPYTIGYPSNTKAMLKIEGELDSMSDKWSDAEWECRRRLVQFRRSQSGSVITATFEPVTLEDRLPNSICVSCIWWEEKQGCYVTSVDTISLLESLVAVRFTVEEKNRIRRNLEGFRPATVSKTKADSEEFFKLIMGFPNPKPRNIEKDVKVFPWRILAGALKKIISKYSASYSSTAGTLQTPVMPPYGMPRHGDAAIDHRPMASPRSASSSASHGHAYPTPQIPQHMYPPHAAMPAGLGIGPSAGQPDSRLTVPTSAGAQATSWHQPSAHYTSDLTGPGRDWSFGGYLTSPATGLPGTVQSYPPYQQRIPSLTGPASMPAEARFVPLQDYEGHSQPTSTA